MYTHVLYDSDDSKCCIRPRPMWEPLLVVIAVIDHHSPFFFFVISSCWSLLLPFGFPNLLCVCVLRDDGCLMYEDVKFLFLLSIRQLEFPPHTAAAPKRRSIVENKVVVEYIDWAAQLGCITFDGVCIVDFTLVRNAELFWAWWEAGRSRGTFPFLVCAGQIHLFDE